MTQLFGPGANSIAKVSVVGGLLLAGGAAWVISAFQNSPYITNVRMPLVQPVPFSHKTHADNLGISCRYCHTTVEKSSFAGLPPTETCMTCHSQIAASSPMLEPVRESYRSGDPIRWNRVYNTPDYVYFKHNVHISKGIGCSTCHGHVDKMPLTWKEQSLHMDWCLNCHRDPLPHLRPKSEIYNMNWQPPLNQTEVALKLAKENGLHTQTLTDCYACHR
jgi:hypothetical protein